MFPLGIYTKMCIYFKKPNDMNISNAILGQPHGLTSLWFQSLIVFHSYWPQKFWDLFQTP